MTNCPYDTYPSSSFWSRAVSRVEATSVDPMLGSPFQITSNTKIATAGSCFAQHISRRLKQKGFCYFVTENCPVFVPEEISKKYGYGVFTARYGNIYTVQQLLQLLLRSYGQREATDDVWKIGERYVDPFRPFVQPDGFESYKHFQIDRFQHYAAVRRMIEEADVFVFTLGLTEAWIDRRDDSVFPVCPGSSIGEFDAARHEWRNFDYSDILEDAIACINLINLKNPSIKIILTVSPVPLVATAAKQHVLTANTYSKSILRSVAGKLEKLFNNVVYFPSYEIVTGNFSRGKYYEKDLRGVTEDGVDHVMQTFFRHFFREAVDLPHDDGIRTQLRLKELQSNQLVCDEERLSARYEARVG